MTVPVYMGIDPGYSGAIAFYSPTLNDLMVFDMPTFKITVNRKKKNQIDMHQLAKIAGNNQGVKLALVEQVNALPAQGVTSCFNFGFAAGAAQMAVVAAGFPMELITPMKWKKAMGLSKDKDASRRLASRLMPKHAHNWTRVMDDGRAEAALLAYYAANRGIKLEADVFS